jgi:uncharacterized protein
MEPSAFNVQVPLPNGDVFLMNTLTDAQLVVSHDAAGLLVRPDAARASMSRCQDDELDAWSAFAEFGFLVPDLATEHEALLRQFSAFREDASQLRITVLTTLQCNFSCEYCYQGDRGDTSQPGQSMSLDTATDVAVWVARQVDTVRPERLVLTFFGGEPLLNTTAMYALAGACQRIARARGIDQRINIITNGLLLSPDIVNRMLPLGLNGIKVTLDGDRETHDRVRPARGGQGTFDRIIDNIRRVADLTPIAIGGNFDAATANRYPALLEFLERQPFAQRISKVAFKPIIVPREANATGPAGIAGLLPMAVASQGSACMSVAGSGAPNASACDSCHLADDHMTRLMAETKRHGFATSDGLHMGPCELYRRHSHTIGPDGARYACPGFTGHNALAIGHVSADLRAPRRPATSTLDWLAPWRRCGACPFIPVCGGGCAVASHAELGDMEAPSCHKRAFESALVSLAEEAASHADGGVQ